MKRKILCLFLLLSIISSMIVIPNSVYAQGSSIVDSYKNILTKHGTDTMSWKTSTGETKTIITYSKYALYDIDKDNSPELLVDDANDSMLYVYTFKSNNTTCWSGYVDVYGSDNGYYEYPNGNGLIMYGGGMGSDHFESISKYVFENEQLSCDEEIASGYTLDGSVKQLRDSLNGYKKIIFKETNDLSLFENLEAIKTENIDLDYLTKYYWYYDCGDYTKYQFNKDGTYITFDYNGNVCEEGQRYSLENNILTFHGDWGDSSWIYVDKSYDDALSYHPEGEKVFFAPDTGYENIANTHEEVPVEKEIKVEGINIYTNEPSQSVTVGSDFLIGVSIIDGNGQHMDLSGVAFSVEDKNILSTGKTTYENGILYCSFTATEVGNAQIKISDYNSNQTATMRFTVNEVTGNAYTIHNIPTVYCDETECNFANFNGLYIDSYEKNLHIDGTCDISFNAYNTLYIHGAVEVYSADGKLIRAFDIDKMDYEESLKDTWDSAVGLTKSLFAGKLSKYQSTTYSKETKINIKNIPQGGYIRISTDPRESHVCGIINALDILSQFKGYVDKINADEDALAKTTIKIIENSANDFSKKWQENFCEEIIGKTINSEDAASNFLDEIFKIFSGDELEELFTEAMISSGIDATADGIENWFVAGTSFIGATLKGMFTANVVMSSILQINQFSKAINRGSIFIQIPSKDERACSNVTVECELEDDVALDVYTFDEESAKQYLKNIEDYYKKNNPQPGETHIAHPVKPSDIDIISAYDITLIQNGEVYNPKSQVRVTIKLPQKLEGKVGEIIVYRMEKDGTTTPIKGVSDGTYVTFITDHFSIYILTSNSNSDISYVSDWARTEVEEAYEKGLIPESLIDQDLTQTISRAEFASIAVTLYEKMSGETAEEVWFHSFKDIENTEYKSDILKAYELGITTGTSNNQFEPNLNITREQLATMLCRVIKNIKLDNWQISTDSTYILEFDWVKTFDDDEYISDYAKNSVYFMASNDIIKGVDNFNFAPLNTATREQAILIALRNYNKLANTDIKVKRDFQYYENSDVLNYGIYLGENPYRVNSGAYFYSTKMFDTKIRESYFVDLKACGYNIEHETSGNGAVVYELIGNSNSIKFIEDYALGHIEIHISNIITNSREYYDGFQHIVSFDSFCGSLPYRFEIMNGANLCEIEYDASSITNSDLDNYLVALQNEGYTLLLDHDDGETRTYSLSNLNDDSYKDIMIIYDYANRNICISIVLENGKAIG